MSYRSLLVLLDQDPLCDARVDFAIGLAAAHDAHLIGLAPTGLVEMPVAVEAATMLADFTSAAWEALRQQAQRAAQRMREQCVAAQLKSFDVMVDEADVVASLVRHAHCADLTLLTQADPDAPGHGHVQAIVEQVVLQSARPTLILPYAGRFERAGRHALVAWDDSREATRAVTDALPLLRKADRVQVLSWPEGDEAEAGLRQRLQDLQRWLKLHGVTAEVAVEGAGIGVADAMLSRAADVDADLIVMGAYGHARWAERMLGGATRGLLASMTVPVLMSH